MEPEWEWTKQTGPFSPVDVPGATARFVLEQTGDACFAVAGDGFQYNGDPSIEVTPETLPKTDFASIPRYMAWLVSRYGPHTPAVLVHDQLVVDGMPFSERRAADDLFLFIMRQIDVPPVSARLMWSAVTLATLWTGGRLRRAAVVLWGLLATAGIALLVAGLVTLTPWLVAVALVGPAVGALAWGDRYVAGLVAGYALPVIAVPALTAYVGYAVYWAIEGTVKLVRRRLPHNQGVELRPPLPYQGR
ncbi:MAG TPA: DUF1353 domain-containing protein [Acidimicrobiales bacterium]|nr:DUF1353 domain-containing protein [Acidimicrobiales bacterium]